MLPEPGLLPKAHTTTSSAQLPAAQAQEADQPGSVSGMLLSKTELSSYEVGVAAATPRQDSFDPICSIARHYVGSSRNQDC